MYNNFCLFVFFFFFFFFFFDFLNWYRQLSLCLIKSKISESIQGSVLCLSLTSLTGATEFKTKRNISLKADQAVLISYALKH